MLGRALAVGIAAALAVTTAGSVRGSTAVPPALLQAQGLSDTTAELLWTAVAGATAYTVYRDGVRIASGPGTLFDDGGLTALSVHAYAVTATVGGVESSPTATSSVTMQAAADTTPPTEPGAITVSGLTSSTASLAWARSSDKIGVEGYRILRGPGGAAPTALTDIWTTDAVPSYKATNLKAGTTYEFGVAALDAGGNISATRTVTFKTAPSSVTAVPSRPSSVSLRAFSSTRIDITWGTSTSSTLAGYVVLRNGSRIGEVDPPARPYFSDTSLTPATTYTYTVEALSSAGVLSSPSVARSATTLSTGQVLVARGPYLQWVTPTSARAVWWTNVPTPSMVAYGVGTATASVADPVLRQEHVMLLGRLTGGAAYVYKVGDGTVTASGTFVTPVAPGTTFSFAAISDFGGGSTGEAQNGALIAADGTSFIQTLGDNVYPEAADPSFTTTYSDYDGRFFRQLGTAFAKKALWTANGNKEYYGNGAWFGTIWEPNNERWYSYDWGSAHILVLDTEQPFSPGTPQYAFAQADLAGHQGAVWRIVALQRPAYSSATANTSSKLVQASLVPLFQAEHVHLAISGNTHDYERTYPLVNGVPTAGGVTYVVTGGGGNGLQQFSLAQPAWSAFREASYYEHLRISVTSTTLEVDGIRADTGAVFDKTVLTGP